MGDEVVLTGNLLEIVSIATNIKALGTSLGKGSADSGPVAVDCAGVWALWGALKHASVVLGHFEGELSEMTRFQMLAHPLVSVLSPLGQVLLYNVDCTVPGLATGTAIETVEQRFETLG